MRRIKREQERNPILEVEKVRKKYCPELLKWFSEVDDPRHSSYTLYTQREIIGVMYYKGLLGLESMRSTGEYLENKEATHNIYHLLESCEKDYLPHYQTINNALSRIEPQEIEIINQKIIYHLIRRKSFDEAKFQKRWLVIVDGTGLYSGKRKINEHCLEKRHKKGTAEETVSYSCAVLEAKIYLGNNIVASICSEFIENNGEDYKRQKGMSEEAIKQDCEIKAFKRLAVKLKKAFPRLPICLLADSLYANEPVMDICKENGWDYILRYKGGSIPSIEEEYEMIPEKSRIRQAEFINAIGYKKHEVNMLRYKVKGKNDTETIFQFLSSIKITKRKAERMGEVGRCRWKIENQGFKRQKHESGDITHALCWNGKAMKNHYLLFQISDLFRRLYEFFYLKKNEIAKTQKKISSDLLHSICQPLAETEDTFERDKAKPIALC